MRRVALISEHASPLAQAGGVDSGGQNIYVAKLARQLAAEGNEVLAERSERPHVARGEVLREDHAVPPRRHRRGSFQQPVHGR